MAGTPTVGQVDAMLQAVVDQLEDQRANGAALLTKWATLEESGKGNYPPAALAAASNNARRATSSGCSGDAARAQFVPVFREYGRLANSAYTTGGSLRALMDDVRDYFEDNSKTIEERNQTTGTPTANGSNLGDGLCSRLVVDALGYPLGAGAHVEVKTLRCKEDQNTGRDKHAELFEAFGEDAGLDAFDVNGSGPRAALVPARHAGTDRAGGSLLTNAAGHVFDATGSVTSMFPGWTLTATANFDQETTNTFRGVPGSDTLAAFKMTAAATMTQSIETMRASLNKRVPYGYRAMVRPNAAADGNITLTLGSKTTTVAVSSLTDDVYNEVLMTVGANSWFENFNQNDLSVKVEWTGTAGEVLIADLIFAPMFKWDWFWYFLRGGATPFSTSHSALLRGDLFTVTDTGGAAADSKIAYWLGRAGMGDVLPAVITAAPPSILDP